jgi:hypothetical protein
MYPQFGNYQAINLSSGTYTLGVLGDGMSAASVNRIYCVTTGTLTITAMGGGTFTTASMSPKDELYVIPRTIVVNSGTFVAFRPKRSGFGNIPRETP